ncbi:hypothetical protein QEN19_004147 [Hanseniaspora menglaensis]
MLEKVVTLPQNGSVGVIGTGISSLFFAYFLNRKRPDLRITLLEKNKQERVGGWIYTKHITDKVILEKGPRTLRGKNIGTALIINSLLKMNPDIKNEIMFVDKASEANKKFLMDYKNPKTLVQMPPTDLKLFYRFMKSGLSDGILKSLIHDLFSNIKSHKEETIQEFMTRRFGNETLVNNVISALFFGIYATDVKELSIDYCLPSLSKLEKEHGGIIKGILKNKSINNDDQILEKFAEGLDIDLHFFNTVACQLKELPLIGFKKGMSTMPDTVKEYLLKQENVTIKYAYDVKKAIISRNDQDQDKKITINDELIFDHVNMSTIPQDLIINHSKLNSYLQRLGTGTNVLLINIYHPSKDLIKNSLKSFGFLVPKSNHSKVLGVIFDSVIETNFQNMYPPANISKVVNKDYTKMTMMVSCDGLEKNKIDFEHFKKNIIAPTLINQLEISSEDVNELFTNSKTIIEFTFANNSIPKYTPGIGFSVDKSKDIRSILEDDLLYTSNISVGGFKFASGPGMPDVVVQSFDAAKRLS